MKLGHQKKADKVRRYLLELVKSGHANPVASALEVFDLSRQSISKHLRWLVENDYLVAEGGGRGRTYKIGPVREYDAVYNLDSIDEHTAYMRDFSYVFEGLPENLVAICHYGFTEILNNAIDHSDGTSVFIRAVRDKEFTGIYIKDNGEGIFKRIARLLDLPDPRTSIIELSKGKLTTDPKNHTGEGIFFTSRAFDNFNVMSSDLEFSHTDEREHDFLLHVEEDHTGTGVLMGIGLGSKRTLEEVFAEFSSGPEDYRFDKTVVPVRLALYEGEQLVSRSQAKRLLNRIERFRHVILDFDGVDVVGQGFADEVFRVFQASHPDIELVPINMSESATMMIKRALANKEGQI